MTRPKSSLSNSDLLSIHSGLNHVVLESRLEDNLAAGDRVLRVRFSKPVLKRPVCGKVADLVLALVKAHPKHWIVEVSAHYSDGQNIDYTETVELEAYAKLDWLTEAYKSAIDEVTTSGDQRILRGVSWKARIKTKSELKHERVGND